MCSFLKVKHELELQGREAETVVGGRLYYESYIFSRVAIDCEVIYTVGAGDNLVADFYLNSGGVGESEFVVAGLEI